jgi:hypothetical protein
MSEIADRYPNADLDAPLEDLPGDVLADMCRRACDSVQVLRDCFDIQHVAAAMALHNLSEGNIDRAKYWLESIRIHPKEFPGANTVVN